MLEQQILNTFIEQVNSEKILWFVFWVMAIITLTVSAMLFYHWHKYGDGFLKKGFAGLIYISGVVVFLGIISASTTTYIALT